MFGCVGEPFVECVRYLCGWSECFLFESYGVAFGFCWLVRVLSSKEYVCCVCDPSVCLGVPSNDVVSVFYFVSYAFWE